MSSPFDPNEWPAGYGPGHGYAGGAGGSGGGGGGGDALPPYSDADAPAADDEALPADPVTGEIRPAAPEAPKRQRKAPPTKAEQRATFLKWVGVQLGQVEAYQQPIAQKPAWCPEWWLHPEVVQRLYVAWKAYQQAVERMSEDKGAKSAWWIQHWDHHARVLFDKQQGPFRACNQAGHLADNDGEPLPLVVELPGDDVKLF